MRARRINGLVATLAVAAVAASPAGTATALTKPQYVAMLKRAGALVAKTEAAAQQAVAAKASPARVRRLFLSWATTETKLGTQFGAVSPPAGVAAANRLLARGEITFGGELVSAANHLPRNAAAIGAYLQQQLGHAKGAAMIDRALAQLKAAGYAG